MIAFMWFACGHEEHMSLVTKTLSPNGNLAQAQKHKIYKYNIKEMALVVWLVVCSESTYWPKAEKFLKQMFRQDG